MRELRGLSAHEGAAVGEALTRPAAFTSAPLAHLGAATRVQNP